MEKNLAKSLTDLIDETLAEIEALKKSDRFSAEEIELDHGADGSTETHAVSKADEEDEKEEDKEDEEEEHKEEEHEDEAKKAEKAYWKAEEECEKAEHAHKEAMKKRDMCKAEHDKHMAKKEHDQAHKSEGVNEMAKEEHKEKKMKKMEKKLAKSIEERVAPLENQISQVLEAVKKLADAPVPARGATYKNVQPLAKGSVEAEPLNKSQVLGELITLKKSGKEVPTEDVLKAEIGSASELQEIATKYGIK
jgi:predicted RNase H-like nuclease (RuvC/YqgF family)